MLILPIVNKNRVMNVEIKIKNASKIKTGVYSDDVGESDIIVNREKFSNSTLVLSLSTNSHDIMHL